MNGAGYIYDEQIIGCFTIIGNVAIIGCFTIQSIQIIRLLIILSNRSIFYSI